MDIKANSDTKARVDKDHLMSMLDLVFRGGHPAEGLSDHRETHGSGEEGEDYCRTPSLRHVTRRTSPT